MSSLIAEIMALPALKPEALKEEVMKLIQEREEGNTFTVTVKDDGDVFINDEFYRQLCFEPVAVGIAVSDYLDGIDADS